MCRIIKGTGIYYRSLMGFSMLQGRGEELNRLDAFFEKKESNAVVLYGEHLSGLKSVWNEFAGGKETIYLKATPASEREQAYLWARTLSWAGDNSFDYSFLSVFRGALSSLDSRNTNKKLLIISDFHLCLTSGTKFLEDLFLFLEEVRKDNRIMILLTTFECEWTEKDLVGILLSMKCRMNGFLRVRPFHFIDLVCSYPQAEFDQMISFYSILGGYSDAYDAFLPALSLKQNIISAFLLPTGRFRYYGLERIREAFREPAVYATILASLAEGRNKLNELYLHTGFSRAKISVYLKNLSAFSLVEKVKSFDTPGAENTKKGMYRISNPIVKFYFTFIYPHETELSLMTEEEFYKEYIEDKIESYYMDVFPIICEEFVILANERGYLPIVISKYGEWVGKEGTVDLIARDEERNFLFGFCNPNKGTFKDETFLHLLSVAKETRITPDYIYLFSLDGFEDKLLARVGDKDNVYLFDRSDLC